MAEFTNQIQPIEKQYHQIKELLFLPFERLTKGVEEIIKFVEQGGKGPDVSDHDYDARSAEERNALHLNETKDLYLANYLKSILPKKTQPLKLLDHMAGTGRMSAILNRELPKAKLTAVDYSEKSLEVARARVNNPSLKTIKASVLDLPFKHETFDAVICADGMEHVYMREHAQCIKEVYRCLKKGGIFIFYTPNLCRLLLELFIQKTRHTLKGKRYGYQKGHNAKDHQDTKLHIGLGTTIHYLRLMHKAGFSDVKEVVFPNEYNIPGLSKRIRSRSWLSPLFTKNITIYGKK